MSSSLLRLRHCQRWLRLTKRPIAAVSQRAPLTVVRTVRTASSIQNRVAVSGVRQYSSTVSLRDYPPHTVFPMPALSPTMEAGTISSWSLEVGDEFAAGDVLCAIETDKASVDFEAQDDGVLAKILKESGGDEISVGIPICVVVEEADDVAAFADFTLEAEPASASAAPTPEATAAPNPAADATAAPTDRDISDEFVLLPSARHLSQSKGVDATVLSGTGKGGRVTKGDVLQALANGTPMPALATTGASAAPVAPAVAPQPISIQDLVDLPVPEIDSAGPYEDVPNNNMRKIIAKRLTESKSQVPHYYSSMEIALDNVLALRKNLANNHEVKVSVNDLIIRSAALALRDVPEVNATYNEKTNQVSMQDSIDISVAVATPTGLITPIVPGTDRLGLSGISDSVRDLATRARDGKLQPHEYQGGTFCISNLGMFGIDEFSAVINPPQAAILAVGGGSPRVVPTPWVEDAEEQAPPEVKTIMTARLSADRRVVDEPTAGLFLAALKHYLSKPELLML